MSENLPSNDAVIRHGYAQVGDVRLHYAHAGQGERLVILLHGFPECWYSWRHQLASLGKHFHVVAPDMRGYNMSDKPPRVEDYQVNRLVDDVTGLIRHFGAREAAVVGHDWGAAVAWAAAQHYPDYVWKVAALQVPPPAVWGRNVTLRQLLRSWYMFFFQIPALPEWLIRRGDFRELGRSMRATSRPGTFTDADIEFYKSALRVPGALTGGINYYRANLRTLLRSRFERREHKPQERIRVPTLFIFGEQDAFIVPETVQGIVDYVDAPYREVRLGRSNHWVQQEFPNEVNAALLSFLKD
ncbi:MAG TPA: alpha/beta hydrolase [Pyrinomonadaceae bacterium]|jgi:pimeloyl-ACP methyl ester carboxylesterase|nr:alpha/beta hydrolase [Pyrinomonadaceae bacterium]